MLVLRLGFAETRAGTPASPRNAPVGSVFGRSRPSDTRPGSQSARQDRAEVRGLVTGVTTPVLNTRTQHHPLRCGLRSVGGVHRVGSPDVNCTSSARRRLRRISDARQRDRGGGRCPRDPPPPPPRDRGWRADQIATGVPRGRDRGHGSVGSGFCIRVRRLAPRSAYGGDARRSEQAGSACLSGIRARAGVGRVTDAVVKVTGVSGVSSPAYCG